MDEQPRTDCAPSLPDSPEPSQLDLAKELPDTLARRIVARISELRRENELLELSDLGRAVLAIPSPEVTDELTRWLLLADAAGVTDRPTFPPPITRWQAVNLLDQLLSAVRRHRRQPANRRRRRRDKKADSARAWKHLARCPNASLRELAAHVGCSVGHAAKLPAWQDRMIQRRRAKAVQNPDPRSVQTTSLQTEIGSDGETLAQFISEQAADARQRVVRQW